MVSLNQTVHEGSLFDRLHIIDRLCKEINTHLDARILRPLNVPPEIRILNQRSGGRAAVTAADDGKVDTGILDCVPVDIPVPLGNINPHASGRKLQHAIGTELILHAQNHLGTGHLVSVLVKIVRLTIQCLPAGIDLRGGICIFNIKLRKAGIIFRLRLSEIVTVFDIDDIPVHIL